jgi:hypothetical protein
LLFIVESPIQFAINATHPSLVPGKPMLSELRVVDQGLVIGRRRRTEVGLQNNIENQYGADARLYGSKT